MAETAAPTAAYMILFMKQWVADTDEKKAEYYTLMKAAIGEHAKKMCFVGLADKTYETGADCPPNTAVLQFDNMDQARACHKAMPAPAEYVKRDMRLIEGPADIFEPGTGYWVAQFEKIIDQAKWDKYRDSFLKMNADGYKIDYADGESKRVSLDLKFLGSSEFLDDAVVGTGNTFLPGVPTDDTGLVIIGKFPDVESAMKYKECEEYKQSTLEALDMKFTTDEDYYATVKNTICTECWRRDVRIFEVKAPAA
mmetsp:Transcript_6762/g.16537  ORF Transcript_6762/g.16537 Transcript_6762/m.16537 type:complete len:253 (+) Transcript_6762:165-923(+)|eukprot:CAMPEP_0178996486 /NCGR_PEP_ID=MMETSP0795-20121207/8391_1 /TAXON_ID=88552 /ORGANISM="Amoebophrya sp., Strain Ameob2" /LENGTH=252 /DNA_ID=CAMNT_0020688873 /DNA_START=100 /DNA_END=858 /DNA_ORIENTATION=+